MLLLTDKNFHGLSEFHYRIRDQHGRSDIKMVGVVTPTPDAPLQTDTMDEDYLRLPLLLI